MTSKICLTHEFSHFCFSCILCKELQTSKGAEQDDLSRDNTERIQQLIQNLSLLEQKLAKAKSTLNIEMFSENVIGKTEDDAVHQSDEKQDDNIKESKSNETNAACGSDDCCKNATTKTLDTCDDICCSKGCCGSALAEKRCKSVAELSQSTLQVVANEENKLYEEFKDMLKTMDKQILLPL